MNFLESLIDKIEFHKNYFSSLALESKVFLEKKNVYKILGYAGLGLKTAFEPLRKIQWDSLLYELCWGICGSGLTQLRNPG